MDISFAIQALCAEHLVRHAGELEPGVFAVPEGIDSEVASLKLESLGVQIDTLTDEQRSYLSAWG
jgi:adenosylhomocysteinase